MTDATLQDFQPASSASSAKPELLTTADGRPLRQALAQAQSRARWRAFALVAPLLLFVLITFVWPIGEMLNRSFFNDDFSANMPALSKWFVENPGSVGVPEDAAAWEALREDLAQARKDRTQGKVGTRVNYDLSGSRSLFTKSARRAERLEAPYKEAFLKLDKRWGEDELWGVMRRASEAYTPSFYIKSLDMMQTPAGDVVSVPDNQRIYLDLFWRTIWISALITAICLILGFPIGYMLATLPLRYSNLLMILVLLPFWTSLLVRTTSWIALLQSQGVLNDLFVVLGMIGPDGALTGFLSSFGAIDSTGRVPMMYNQAGTIIAMTHILLPFMILPLYSVMKTINPSYLRAAKSLGATDFTAFWRVYFPLSVPGIGAGAILVF
ncbi:MAG: ABC transporter permease, partial [Pseudomonadota bacterium]